MRSKPMHGKKAAAPVQSMDSLISMPGPKMVMPTSRKSKTPKYKEQTNKGKNAVSRKSADLARSVNDITSNPLAGMPIPGKPKGTVRYSKGQFNTAGHRGTGNPYSKGTSGGFFK